MYADLEIAHKLGIKCAFILERIAWSISTKTEKDRKEYYFDGQWWMSSTIEDFTKYTSIKKGAVLRTLKKLSDNKLISIKRRVSQVGQRPNFYTVNFDELSRKFPSFLPNSHFDTLPGSINEPGGVEGTETIPSRVTKQDHAECHNDTELGTETIPSRVTKQDTLSKSLLRVFSESSQSHLFSYGDHDAREGALVFAPEENSSFDQATDEAGTKNVFDAAESSKNTPLVDGKGSGSAMTPEDLFRLWNQLSGSLPKCRGLSDKRKKQCKLRLKENPDEAYWKTVIENLAKSKFAKEGGWASFDWIIKNYENGDKAFNGNYNDKVKSNPNAIDTEAAEHPW